MQPAATIVAHGSRRAANPGANTHKNGAVRRAMTFAEALLNDLAAEALVETWRGRGVGAGKEPSALTPADRHLLLGVASELYELGAVIAILASIANVAEARAFAHFDVASLRAFTPSCSLLVSRTLEAASRCEPLSTVAQHGQTLRVRLSLARRVTKTHLDNVSHIDGRALCPIEIVADSWRRACRAALALLSEIEAALVDPGTIGERSAEGDVEEGLPAALSTAALLRDAALGAWPCVDPSGQLQVPGWAERRTGVRRKISLAAIAVIGADPYPAHLRDISRTGVGISVAAAAARAGRAISLRLPCGRRLSGTIRWSAAGNAGIAFNDSLAPDDALLTHLSDATETA